MRYGKVDEPKMNSRVFARNPDGEAYQKLLYREFPLPFEEADAKSDLPVLDSEADGFAQSFYEGFLLRKGSFYLSKLEHDPQNMALIQLHGGMRNCCELVSFFGELVRKHDFLGHFCAGMKQPLQWAGALYDPEPKVL